MTVIERFWSKTRVEGACQTLGVNLGDQVVMHTCDNPRCVNVQHLVPGTQAQNLADMRNKGRSRPRNSRNHGTR